MSIKLLSVADYPALFLFEQKNWDFFHQWVPERPDSYRQYDTFCDAQSSLIDEQEKGVSAFHVIYDK